MNYLDLFISFFQIGLLSFGGGMAAIPLIQEQVVDGHGWLSMTEFTDLITIAEMTPGPITINSSTFVGIRTAGLPGAIIATVSSFLCWRGCISNMEILLTYRVPCPACVRPLWRSSLPPGCQSCVWPSGIRKASPCIPPTPT